LLIARMSSKRWHRNSAANRAVLTDPLGHQRLPVYSRSAVLKKN
jgi:hypothetical protein